MSALPSREPSDRDSQQARSGSGPGTSPGRIVYKFGGTSVADAPRICVVARLVMSGTSREVTRRQDAPPVYDITTVAYAANPEFVLKSTGLFAGRCSAAIVPLERSLDIDTEYDWQMAEFLMSRRMNEQSTRKAA